MNHANNYANNKPSVMQKKNTNILILSYFFLFAGILDYLTFFKNRLYIYELIFLV